MIQQEKEDVVIIQTTTHRAFLILIRLDKKTPQKHRMKSTEIGKKITELASIDDTREEEGQHNRLH